MHHEDDDPQPADAVCHCVLAALPHSVHHLPAYKHQPLVLMALCKIMYQNLRRQHQAGATAEDERGSIAMLRCSWTASAAEMQGRALTAQCHATGRCPHLQRR